MENALSTFSEQYGTSCIMFLVFAVCVGALVEVVKKNVFGPLNQKYSGKEYEAVKYSVYGVVGFALSAWFVGVLLKSLDYPGGMKMYPLYLTLFYMLQLLVSMTGIKGIVNAVTKGRDPGEPKKRYKKVMVEVDENGDPVGEEAAS